MNKSIVLILLSVFTNIACSQNKIKVENYTETKVEKNLTLQLGSAMNLTVKQLDKENGFKVFGLKSKEVENYKFRDTIITFDPMFNYETFELIDPIPSPGNKEILLFKKKDVEQFPANFQEIKLVNSDNAEYQLTSFSVELIGGRKRGIYFGQMGASDIKALNEKKQELFEWMFEGIKKGDKISIGTLVFNIDGKNKVIGDTISFILK